MSSMATTHNPGTALVTGAGAGIGRALSLALAQRGWTVVVTDLRETAAKETLQALESTGGRGSAYALDVTDASAWARLIDQLPETPSLLVNNAGIGGAGEVRDLSPEHWTPIVDVNLRGVAHGVQAVYPAMAEAGRGAILNIASGAGLCPRPGMVPYAAAKHAVVGLSTSLRAEAAAHGVRVCVACPGYIATDILRNSQYVGVDARTLTERIPIRPMSAQDCARRILRGLDRNRAVIPIGGGVTAEWLLYRIAPGLVHRLARIRARAFREARR
ncbi:MAG: SDR family NAD(P)-dependent oxidoreductase [Deltaproteobacteria bacterium]|nr:MAG: SDR family NAD(P)-dependent oxidoreductase [Deltaproteobacteria bacterium]